MTDLPPGRQAALTTLAAGLWPGTDQMLASLVKESMGAAGWRAGRAALLRAYADTQERVWMHPEELKAWIDAAKARNMRRGLGTTYHQTDLGVSYHRLRDLFDRKRAEANNYRIPKPLALACAHDALGLPKPVQDGDDEALLAWFTPRFGAIGRVALFLGVTDEWLRARLRGWDLRQGERVDAPPEGYAIRALDWLWRMGPMCPYGDRPDTAVFPGQEITS